MFACVLIICLFIYFLCLLFYSLVFLSIYYYYYYFTLFEFFYTSIIIYSLEFSHQRKLMVFHWRLSDSKSSQVSRTLLSMLAVFNNAVVWIVFTIIIIIIIIIIITIIIIIIYSLWDFSHLC